MTTISLRLELLKKAQNLTDVAKILDLKPAHLSYALYKLDTPGFEPKYVEFTVPKKAGGVRTIKAPHKALKAAQKRLAKDLLEIEQVLEMTRIKHAGCILAHGFKKKLSIMTNGENHRNRRYVFNVDLKDFFPALNFGRVRGFFMKHDDFRLNEGVATILAQIACHDNQLPQGSPCSPVISNLIASVLDVRLNELARQYNCTYTRYADDITFSTSEKLFPSAIGRRESGSINRWEAGPKMLKAIARAGFELNPAKTRMLLDWSRQEVTGVVVNQKVNIPADYYATTAAMCQHLFMNGTCFTMVGGVKKPFPLAKLRGRLAYIYQVRGKGPKTKPSVDDTEDKPKLGELWASTNLFKKFVDYADLYGIEKPVILCEGVTDNIYLKAAIQRLAPKYPTLTTTSGELKVRLFKYTKTSAAIQHLGGGGGDLGKLAYMYPQRIKKFKSGSKHPLILIGDNDDGSQKLFGAVKKITGKTVDGADPWYYLGQNMYVVPIPKVGGIDTPIERLFEQELLDAPYEGKTFNRTNASKDPTKYFDKKVFATQVVAKKKAIVKFDGFEPLLNAIVSVIDDYKANVAPTPVAPPAVTLAAAVP